MAYRLPPMNSLRLFEAAGRHLSFRQAAYELKITASAVSHGIQSLEDWLGVALFVRTTRGMVLTEAGRQYLPAVRKALTVLASASGNFPTLRSRNNISLSVAPTFASRLLLPRIGAFNRLHPEIQLSIDTNHRQVEFPRAGVDAAIRIGRGVWPGLTSTQLLTETIVPVCAPQLVAKFGSAEILKHVPLIHVSSLSEDWQSWSLAAKRALGSQGGGLAVDTIQMAIEAAVNGLGVMLGRKPFIQAELDSGQLVEFGEAEHIAESSYWFVGPSEAMTREDLGLFRDWLIAELATLSAERVPAKALRVPVK